MEKTKTLTKLKNWNVAVKAKYTKSESLQFF